MTIVSVNLSSEILDKLKIYRENFEKAYLEATEEFYKSQAAAYLQENGVQNYMKYVRIDERSFCCWSFRFSWSDFAANFEWAFFVLQYMLKNVAFNYNNYC